MPFDVVDGDLPPPVPRYNIAPTQLISVIRMVAGSPRHSLLRWGLIPHWVKDAKPRIQINARGETLLDKPYFRTAARKRRCLILADGFYEWKRDANDKPLQAFFFERVDGRPFVMAGLWEVWISPANDRIETVAVVTTDANADVAPVHDRMPVILAPEDYLSWLDAERVDAEHAMQLVRPPPNGTLIGRPVSNRVNKVVNDDATNLDPTTPSTPSAPPKPPRRKPKDDPGQGSLF